MSETALAQFLKQKGIEPTGSKERDLELARPFFKTYKQYKEGLKICTIEKHAS